MFFKILLNKIVGYTRITIEGFFIERFINICKTNNILLWGIKKENESLIHANISIKNFKKIKGISKKTKCRVHIENKKGFPFIFNKYKKRKIFLISSIIVFFIIFILSNFIWNIEITGNNKILKEEILSELDSNGLKIGILKNKIDKDSIINKIRLDRNDISWIGIDIKGTNVVVKIVEADDKPEVINSNEFCNIVAEKDCIIEKIDANNGTALVKKGDVVKKGDILIAGWMQGKYTGIRYIHAMGNVKAKVYYSEKEKISLREIEKQETGKKEKKYEIKFNNFKINFYKTLSKFQKYDTIYEKHKLKIFSDFYLPIEVTKISNFELKEEEKVYSIEEAKNIATENAEERLNAEIEDENEILNKTFNVNQTEDYVEVEVIYEVLENIGTESK